MDQLVQINIINLHRTSAESLLESIPDSLNYQVTEYTYTTVKVDSLEENSNLADDKEPDEERRKGFLKRMSDFLSGKKKKEIAQEIAPTISQQVDSTVKSGFEQIKILSRLKRNYKRLVSKMNYLTESFNDMK